MGPDAGPPERVEGPAPPSSRRAAANRRPGGAHMRRTNHWLPRATHEKNEGRTGTCSSLVPGYNPGPFFFITHH